MNEKIMEAYREWFMEQPCHTPIESMEAHVARFVSWFITHKVAAIEHIVLQQNAA
jgi:hypothetical protein